MDPIIETVPQTDQHNPEMVLNDEELTRLEKAREILGIIDLGFHFPFQRILFSFFWLNPYNVFVDADSLID